MTRIQTNVVQGGTTGGKKSSEIIHLTRRQRELIALLIKDNSLSFSNIAVLWHVSDSTTVQKHFDNLKAKGLMNNNLPFFTK